MAQCRSCNDACELRERGSTASVNIHDMSDSCDDSVSVEADHKQEDSDHKYNLKIVSDADANFLAPFDRNNLREGVERISLDSTGCEIEIYKPNYFSPPKMETGNMCDVQIDQLKYGGVIVTRRLPDGTSEVKKYDDYDEEFMRLYG